MSGEEVNVAIDEFVRPGCIISQKERPSELTAPDQEVEPVFVVALADETGSRKVDVPASKIRFSIVWLSMWNYIDSFRQVANGMRAQWSCSSGLFENLRTRKPES